jgi:PGF-CTERM protein
MFSQAGSSTFFTSINLDSNGLSTSLESGASYRMELVLVPGENPYLSTDEFDENQTVSTTFTIEDANIDITGSTDDQDRFVTPISSNAELTGTTNLAPGTRIRAQARATGDNSFAESPRGEVGEDGSIAIPFDTSGFTSGNTFTITLQDTAGTTSAEGTGVFGGEVSGAQFQVTGLQPQEGSLESDVGEINVSATITNEGESEGTKNVELRLGGETQQTKEDITLGAGESTEVTFTADLSPLGDGEYEHSIWTEDDEAAGSFTIGDGGDESGDDSGDDSGGDDSGGDDSGGDDSGDDGQPGFGLAVGLLAILGAALLALRRQN